MDRPTGEDDWVFPAFYAGLDGPWEPYKQWTLLSRFRQTLKKAAMDPEAYRFHDLRATFAVNAIRAGRPLNEVQAILGHESPHMTLHYAKFAREEQANASLHEIESQLIPTRRAKPGPNLLAVS
jgi:integrase